MSEAKIAKTSPSKIELQAGKKYAFCTCGLSESQPLCDGAHKGGDFSPLIFEAEKDETAFFCNCKQTKKAPFCDGSHSSLAKE